MTPADIIRDASARHAALRQYAAAHDRFAELEQRLLLTGKEIEAAGAHAMGTQVLRAWLAENDNPEPKGLEVA